MRRKILSLFLVFTVIVSTFLGCGSNDDTVSKEEYSKSNRIESGTTSNEKSTTLTISDGDNSGDDSTISTTSGSNNDDVNPTDSDRNSDGINPTDSDRNNGGENSADSNRNNNGENTTTSNRNNVGENTADSNRNNVGENTTDSNRNNVGENSDDSNKNNGGDNSTQSTEAVVEVPSQPVLNEEIEKPADAVADVKNTEQGTITLYMFTEPTSAEENTAKNIISSIITQEMSEFDKVKAIHDYIVNQNVYPNPIPYEDYSIFTASGVFAGNAVCQGYTDAFSLLCYYANIQTEIVSGTANGGGHSWNQVRVDNVWYNIDVTWDDPIYTCNGQRENVKTYNYFLITDEEISKDHIADYYSNKHICNTTIAKDSVKKEECIDFAKSYYTEYTDVIYYAASVADAKNIINAHIGSGEYVLTFIKSDSFSINEILTYIQNAGRYWSYSYAYSGNNVAICINIS